MPRQVCRSLLPLTFAPSPYPGHGRHSPRKDEPDSRSARQLATALATEEGMVELRKLFLSLDRNSGGLPRLPS